MKIYKYPLQSIDRQTIEMPVDAEILSVQVQHGTPCLWAVVDPDTKKESRTFAIFGTGHEIDDETLSDMDYISTFQLDDGHLVFHVFEIQGDSDD